MLNIVLKTSFLTKAAGRRPRRGSPSDRIESETTIATPNRAETSSFSETYATETKRTEPFPSCNKKRSGGVLVEAALQAPEEPPEVRVGALDDLGEGGLGSYSTLRRHSNTSHCFITMCN